MVKKIKKVITNPNMLFMILSKRGLFNFMPDELHLKILYRITIGKKLDLENPKTFNEKLQWLKLYNRNPQYTNMVDKYEAKKYVADIIGEQHIIPTLGIWDSFEEINFDILPNQFVLKCTHDSGGVIIVKDKKKMNKFWVKRRLEKSLKTNYFYMGREWPYKDVKPRIIAEEYMEEAIGGDLKDYKFMCFNGKVKCLFVCSERGTKDGLRVTFYDTEWNVMPFERHYPKSDIKQEKPVNYFEMVKLAEKLAQDIPFVRVDFYEINGNIYFGEITFYPGNGTEEFSPDEWDEILGSWIELPSLNEKDKENVKK